MIDHASFKDPSGFVFIKQKNILRQVNKYFKDDFDFFLNSGLYKTLSEKEMLVKHEEMPLTWKHDENAYKVLKPEKINFISYPYEWCFSQLKDAALLTLEVAKSALEKNMVLKDASAFNVQFKHDKPIFIDTLSFERYKEGEPWTAYRQFCEHFLGPLALTSYTNINFIKLLGVHLDGIPLKDITKLLPLTAKFKLRLFMHLVLHSKFKSYYSDKPAKKRILNNKLSKEGLMGILNSLEKTIKALKIKNTKTEWSEYYNEKCNYARNSLERKRSFAKKCIDNIKPKIVWDLGANNGEFSKIAAKYGMTIAFDNDFQCTEEHYLRIKNQEKNILPLIMDLTNLTPSLGWALKERKSIIERGPADMIFMFALIHHLVISHNIPFDKIASFLASVSNHVIIEFVPKEDSQVQKLLMNRKDIFKDYTQKNFEQTIERYFDVVEKEKLVDSERTLYLLKNKIEF